jgi:assimilatory nitrate reductase catalytic subunit
MSSAVTGYKLALGADGPPTCYDDLEHAKTVLFAGSNAAWAHPVLFRRLEDAKARDPDVRWIVVDPRRTDTAAMADLHLQIQPGTDVALFNGMLHHLVWEGLLDQRFIAAHTSGFDELKTLLREYTPRMSAEICGIAAADLVIAAEWFGRSPAALSLYCMGLNQSAHGTDKNLALIHLHLATGQIGRPGAGPFSLTGQPNAMGGREVGGMATMLAAHRELDNAAHRAEVESLWKLAPGTLPAKPGLAAVELFDALHSGKVKAVWIACTNPAHSMPDAGRVREALQRAEYVIVQEAFAGTDTVPFADVLLPASTWGAP